MWVFGIVMLILSVIAAIGFTIAYKRMGNGPVKKKKNNTAVNDEEQTTMSKSEIKGLKKKLGIRKIHNNMITMNDGNMRAILSISSPDFELLTEEEQSVFENSLMQFALSLSFPVQFFTTTIKIETKDPVRMIDNFLKSDVDMDLEKLKGYAEALKLQLESIENERGIHVRQSYCIVGTDFVADSKRMVNELRNRADTVINGLSAARMKVSILNSKRIAQLLADYFNKFSNNKIEDLIENGALELYNEGLGVVIYDVVEKEPKTENNQAV